MSDFNELVEMWSAYKEQEAAAVSARRLIEDRMAELAGINQAFDGTVKVSGIKITGRLSYKVNSEALSDIISENNASDSADALFRWKPELNIRAFKEADEETTALFSECITLQAGRPSFALDTTSKE